MLPPARPGDVARLVQRVLFCQGAARSKAHVWVPQLGPTDCGLAALAMVSLRLDAPVSVELLRAKVTLGPQGLTLPQMEQLGAEVGVACRAVRVSADRLRQVSLAAIALLRDGHYVVRTVTARGGI